MTYWLKSTYSGPVVVRPDYHRVIMVGDTIPVLMRRGSAHLDGMAIIEGQDYRSKELIAKVYVSGNTAPPQEARIPVIETDGANFMAVKGSAQ